MRTAVLERLLAWILALLVATGTMLPPIELRVGGKHYRVRFTLEEVE